MQIIAVGIVLVVLGVIVCGIILALGLFPLSYAKEVQRVDPVSDIVKTAPDNPPVYTDVQLEQLRQGDYFVDAVRGSDDNDGTSEQTPFATLARAQQAVRERIANGHDADIEVVIRQGSYALEETWKFDHQDSMQNHKVVYRNYPYEYPILEGYKIIQGFRPYRDGIYVADIPKDVNFRNLTEDGKMATVARYPDEGYLQVKKHFKHNEADTCISFGYGKDTMLDLAAKDNGVECAIFPGGEYGEWNWFFHIYPVADINIDEHVVTLDRSGYSQNVYCMGKGSRYFMQNSLSFLNREGEFYVDVAQGKLYYKPFDASNLENGIRYACVENLICMEDAQNIEIRGLILRGTNGADYASDRGAAVSMQSCSGIAIMDCLIYQTGKFGVLGISGNHGITVSGCEIYNIGHTGVQINGNGKLNDNVGHTIANNTIHHTGIVIRHGAGIQLYFAQDCKIQNNTIAYTPRYSISLKGSLEPLKTKSIFERYERGEYVDEMPTRNNLIAYNDCSYANYDTQDTGAIELWGAGYDNAIYNNVVHDCTVYFSFGYGIYVDDYNIRTTLENNILYNIRARTLDDPYYGDMHRGEVMTGIFVKYQGNVIRNNIVANSDTTAAYLAYDYVGNFGVEKVSDTVFEKNISYNAYNAQKMQGFLRMYSNILLDLGKARELKGTESYDTATYLQSSDYNLIWVDTAPQVKWGKDCTMRVDGFGNKSLTDWIAKSGYDAHSRIANPLFADPNNADFGFLADSPAKELGIQEIDVSDVGSNSIWID